MSLGHGPPQTPEPILVFWGGGGGGAVLDNAWFACCSHYVSIRTQVQDFFLRGLFQHICNCFSKTLGPLLGLLVGAIFCDVVLLKAMELPCTVCWIKKGPA